MKLVITTDGACKPNPGIMSVGVLVQVLSETGGDSKVLAAIHKEVGYGTSVKAEYRAIAEGLEWAISNHAKEVVVFTDSQLCERQLSGQYRVKEKSLLAEKDRVVGLLGKLPEASIRWHSRSSGMGPIADALAKGGETAHRVLEKLLGDEKHA